MSKIIRHVTSAPAVSIGEKHRDAVEEATAAQKLGEIFPLVSMVTTRDGEKLIPVQEVIKMAQKLQQDCEASRQQGYEEGHETGLQEGLKEARKVLGQLEQAISDAVDQRATLLQEAKQRILELVVQISKKVTFEAQEIDRESTVALIDNVIGQLVDRSRLRIKVHPDHLPVVEQNIDRFLVGSTSIKELTFEADPRVRMGGCFIETPTGDIDARLESQFEIITETLLSGEEEH
ncbi:MAG: hypothetical protein DRP45_07005 [Candidatus Zixiibacteriota bacterium]|nr:MAG: hypothetical protein DRP45_07005 [candidate division Zixibacteria bacterium]